MHTDLETSQLDELTIRGGWHLLCTNLLHDATMRVKEARNVFRKARGVEAYADRGWGISQRDAWESAERWIKGGVGVITFEDCCDMMNVSPEVARQKIEEYAHENRRERPAGVPW
jgi:hypothetical protein